MVREYYVGERLRVSRPQSIACAMNRNNGRMTVVTYFDPLAVDRDGKEFAGYAQLACECCEPVGENQRVIIPCAGDAPVGEPLAVLRIHPRVELLAIPVDHPELTVPDNRFVPAVGACRPEVLVKRRLRRGVLSLIFRRRLLLWDWGWCWRV